MSAAELLEPARAADPAARSRSCCPGTSAAARATRRSSTRSWTPRVAGAERVNLGEHLLGVAPSATRERDRARRGRAPPDLRRAARRDAQRWRAGCAARASRRATASPRRCATAPRPSLLYWACAVARAPSSCRSTGACGPTRSPTASTTPEPSPLAVEGASAVAAECRAGVAADRGRRTPPAGTPLDALLAAEPRREPVAVDDSAARAHALHVGHDGPAQGRAALARAPSARRRSRTSSSCGYAAGDRTLGVMPLYHTMGMRSLLAAMSLLRRAVRTSSRSSGAGRAGA